MFAKTVVTFASLLAAASALKVTAPTLGAAWDLSQTNTVEWESVVSDPSNFSIVLVDQSSSSGAKSLTIAPMVNTADKKYSFTNFVAPPGDKYIINLVGTGTTNAGLLAQSQQFNVTKSGTAASTTSGGSGATPTDSGTPAATTSTKNDAGKLIQTFGFAAPVVGALYLLL